MPNMIRTIVYCILCLFFCERFAMATPPAIEQVFKFNLQVYDPNTALLTWKIKPGYFLYRDRIHLNIVNPSQAILATPGDF